RSSGLHLRDPGIHVHPRVQARRLFVTHLVVAGEPGLVERGRGVGEEPEGVEVGTARREPRTTSSIWSWVSRRGRPRWRTSSGEVRYSIAHSWSPKQPVCPGREAVASTIA